MTDRKPAMLGLGRTELFVFVAYLLMVGFAVSFYQPFEDEGRGWLLSRHYAIYPLLFRVLRYEGHPALWYLVLWVPAHLHMPFVGMNWISASIASLGIYTLLRLSPFPLYLKALLPFGFYLGYQYAVVARSYVLFPLLGFLVAHFYRSRTGNPIMLSVALALLANVSIHGTIVAIAFAILYGWKLLQQSRKEEMSSRLQRDAWIGTALFTSSIVLVAVCLWPAQDLQAPLSPEVQKILRKIVPPVKPTNISYEFRERLYEPLAQHNVSQGQPIQTPESKLQAVLPVAESARTRLDRRLGRVGRVLWYSFATFYPLAFGFQALVLTYLYRNGKLKLILPALLLFLFLSAIYAAVWHLGLLWVTLILVLWTSWDESVNLYASNLQNGVALSLGLLCVMQLPWTFGALRYQMSHATYPSKEAASYLKTLPPGTRMDGLGLGLTVLPYFQQNIFDGNGGRTLDHHDINPSTALMLDLTSAKDDLLLVDDYYMSSRDLAALSSAGYRRTHSFCGGQYLPNFPDVPLCLLIFERIRVRGFIP